MGISVAASAGATANASPSDKMTFAVAGTARAENGGTIVMKVTMRIDASR